MASDSSGRAGVFLTPVRAVGGEGALRRRLEDIDPALVYAMDEVDGARAVIATFPDDVVESPVVVRRCLGLVDLRLRSALGHLADVDPAFAREDCPLLAFVVGDTDPSVGAGREQGDGVVEGFGVDGDPGGVVADGDAEALHGSSSAVSAGGGAPASGSTVGEAADSPGGPLFASAPQAVGRAGDEDEEGW